MNTAIIEKEYQITTPPRLKGTRRFFTVPDGIPCVDELSSEELSELLKKSIDDSQKNPGLPIEDAFSRLEEEFGIEIQNHHRKLSYR